MAFTRYLDVWLLLASAPLVVIAGLPVLGYALATLAWVITRAGSHLLQARAAEATDARARAGLAVAGIMSRVWLVALAVIAAKFAGGKADGVMAAVTALAAFTVYFVMSFFNRGPLFETGGGPQRRPAS